MLDAHCVDTDVDSQLVSFEATHRFLEVVAERSPGLAREGSGDGGPR
jgi:hypothetical protein